MLILIGTVPTAYALNRALPESQIEQFADEFSGREPDHRAARPPATTCSAIRALP